MKNLKAILFVAIIGFVGNQSIQAQNKVKENAQDVKVEKEEAVKKLEAVAIEQKMQRAMETATPEQRAKYEAKMTAYRKEAVNVDENRFVNKNAELKRTFADTKATKEMLEKSSAQIKKAQERLDLAKEAGTLTAEEIQSSEAKIIAAEKELKEARAALDNKIKIIMREHTEMINN